MYSTNIDGAANSGGCNHEATQPAAASDANRFAQLMSQSPQNIQGNQPPPPPPPGNAEAMNGVGDRPPPPPPPPPGSEEAEDGVGDRPPRPPRGNTDGANGTGDRPSRPFGGNADGANGAGDRPPPPPPPGTQNASNSEQSSSCADGDMRGSQPPPPPQGADGANELSELSSSEDFVNIINQLMLALQPMDFSNVYDFGSSSDLLSGSFGDYSDESYFGGSFA